MKIHILKIKHFKFCPVIGFGYWKDVYLKKEVGVDGITHNFILPFIRIQWGYITTNTQASDEPPVEQIQVELSRLTPVERKIYDTVMKHFPNTSHSTAMDMALQGGTKLQFVSK